MKYRKKTSAPVFVVDTTTTTTHRTFVGPHRNVHRTLRVRVPYEGLLTTIRRKWPHYARTSTLFSKHANVTDTAVFWALHAHWLCPRATPVNTALNRMRCKQTENGLPLPDKLNEESHKGCKNIRSLLTNEKTGGVRKPTRGITLTSTFDAAATSWPEIRVLTTYHASQSTLLHDVTAPTACHVTGYSLFILVS